MEQGRPRNGERLSIQVDKNNKFKSDSFNINFIVIENLAMEAIIGMDQFWSLGININGKEKTIEFKDKIYQLEDFNTISAIEDTLIRPFARQNVNIIFKGSFNGSMGIKSVLNEDFIIEDGIIDSHSKTLILRNTSINDLIIEKGTVIGNICPLEKEEIILETVPESMRDSLKSIVDKSQGSKIQKEELFKCLKENKKR